MPLRVNYPRIVDNLAKRKSRRSSSKKLSVLATAGAIGTGATIYEGYKNAGFNGVRYVSTGIGDDGHMHFDRVVQTYAPVVAGAVGSMIVAKVGLNRKLNIPFLKL